MINPLLTKDIPISSGSIFFEILDKKGLKEMHVYSIKKELYEFFEFEPFKEINDTEKYIEKLTKRMDAGNSIYWFIRLKSNNNLIGTASLSMVDFNRKSTEQGFALDPDYWGQGYIFEIQDTLKDYVFNKLGFNRLYGITMLKNEKTIAAALASGFKKEAIVKDYYFKNGKHIDGWSYYMLASEYFKNDLGSERSGTVIKMDNIINVFSEVFEDKGIDKNLNMKNYDKWDSVMHINIILQISKKFNLNFTPEEITKANSIQEIFDIIRNK